QHCQRICLGLACVAVLAASPHALTAQAAHITVVPAHPKPGSIVRFTLDASGLRGDSILAVHGSLAGEPLHFISAGARQWHAIGGVPVDPSGRLVAEVVLNRAAGGVDTLHETLPLTAPAR